MVKALVITKFMAKGRSRDYLLKLLTEAGFDEDEIVFGSVAAHDFPFDQTLTKADIKEATSFLSMVVDDLNITHVLTLGNEALTAATGHSGIMKWRGRMLSPTKMGVPVMATIATAVITRNPSQRLNLLADLKYFYNAVHDIEIEGDEPPIYEVIDTKAKLMQFCNYLRFHTEVVSFDLETSGFDEFAEDAFIVSVAVTTKHRHGTHSTWRSTALSGGDKVCFVVPLHHRASVWRTRWQSVIRQIGAAMREVPVRVAHNGKFDCRWLKQFDAECPTNFDTMLAAHVLEENRSKGLKPLARILLGAGEWDIKIENRKGVPWYNTITLKEILKYNGLDTWHTMRLYELFRKQLSEQPRLLKLFTKLIMPASQSLVHIERRGVFLDTMALADAAGVVQGNLQAIEELLMEWVPASTPMPVNFGPSNFLRWWLYEHLGLPVLKSGKTGPSVAETVLSHLKDEHPAVPLLLERVSWAKHQSSFINPYIKLITPDSRIRTTFKLAGTVTGRLSSGKADADKVTGSRASTMRGVNLQQVPRDKLIRSLFGAAPGWTFVEADYSQVELRIAAFIAQEPTMLMLYASGQDIHMTMAMRMTGKPASEVTSEERKKAKAVNFGFLYGMGWRKFIETAWNNYGVTVTEAEAQAFRRAFFEQFPQLIRWHARQRRLAHRYKRVESPLGRVRHLPDIDSPDEGVVAEAERQAINSPVQAMASDLCLLSMVLLDREFRRLGLKAAPIGTVHDAINFEIPDEELEVVLPIIRETMENPPLEKLFGVSLTVPIIADIKVGTRWGTGKELERV